MVLIDLYNKIVYYFKRSWGFIYSCWYFFRCWVYFHNPRLYPLSRFFVNNLAESLASAGIYVTVENLVCTPYEHTFAVYDPDKLEIISETLVSDIIRNTYKLQEGKGFTTAMLSTTASPNRLTVSFKPRDFLTIVGLVYRGRRAKRWEWARDFLEMSGTAFLNMVSIATIIGGSVLLFLLWLLYLVSPTG